MPAFWDGGRKMIVRFTPTEPGQWTYRITSNLPAFDGKEGMFNAAASDAPGFVNVANVHHWATDNKQPHLWMGFIADRFAFASAAEFDQQLNTAAQNKFNHFRGSILGGAERIARWCISARIGRIQPISTNSIAASRKFTSAESLPI